MAEVPVARPRASRPTPGPVAALALPLAVLLAVLLHAPAALAHGGQYAGPGGRRAPGDPTPPPPPAPRNGPAPTTPGSGQPSSQGALPDTWWGTWWQLNRWLHLPPKGAAVRARGPVTGAAPAEPAARLDTDAALRRLLVGQQIRPYLLTLLAPTARDETDLRAAAALALAKVDATPETLELLLRLATDPKEELVVRESATLAVGLLRRSDPAARLDAVSVELARMTLVDVATGAEDDLRVRCFACLSLGLLADQPYAGEVNRDGRLVVQALRQVLELRARTADLPVAALVGLSLQPPAGVPEDLREHLRAAVLKGLAFGRKPSDLERAHAVTALARLGAGRWPELLLRLLGDRRLPAPLARAARLALGEHAGHLDAERRAEAVAALLKAEGSASDNLSVGLGRVAAARLLAADLAAGSDALLGRGGPAERLLAGPDTGSYEQRGFHALALGLAVQGTGPGGPGAEFRAAARRRLRLGLADGRDPDTRSAFAAGLALARDPEAGPQLLALVRDRNEVPQLRAQAALALGPAGVPEAEAVPALEALLLEDRVVAPRGAAALGLTFYRGAGVTDLLGEQLRQAATQADTIQLSVALGQTHDPRANFPLLCVARDAARRSEVRALAVAALGILADPEPRPSLLRLSAEANYVGRTDALSEAFSIL